MRRRERGREGVGKATLYDVSQRRNLNVARVRVVGE